MTKVPQDSVEMTARHDGIMIRPDWFLPFDGKGLILYFKQAFHALEVRL